MVMILNEEQQLLKDSAKAFLNESSPVSALRTMRDSGNDHMPELWSKMSEMGWPGVVIPDAYSGLEFG
ncbi:MAG: acyl-CoA dehydrogenase, partial [Halieaceae bacterium]|nr:acyl-CoA dehydrogenase [Halieaceae bacterium]